MIDVVWVSLHDGILARSYWDQSLLESLFSGRLWLHNLEFEHHEFRGPGTYLKYAGAIVVIPARHHSSPADVDVLREFVSSLPWAIVILTGDEEADFPWRELRHDHRRIYIMSPRPGVHDGADYYLGSGWQPGTPEILAEYCREKDLDWAFLGQVTHPVRHELSEVLFLRPGGLFIGTESFTAGFPQREYLHELSRAKVAPCPSGPETPDTFRFYEALEAGCIPVVDESPSHDPIPHYWRYLHHDDVPFPVLTSWKEFPDLLPRLLADWPMNVVRIGAWWQGQKRRFAQRLRDDLIQLGGSDLAIPWPDPITVIMPTSPAPLHPSTADIEKSISTVREQLPHSEIILACDGVRPEQEHLRTQYEEYLRRIVFHSMHTWTGVLPVIAPEWLHQANLTRLALTYVHTPYILFMEHDTTVEREIPWTALCDWIRTGTANIIRLHHEASILPDHIHMMLDQGGEIRRTVQWSQRPHLARADFYRHMLDQYFPLTCRTMIEDVMHGALHNEWLEFGFAGWDRFRIYLYAPEGDMKRSWHLDSRGDEPKYDMQFE